MQQDSKLVESVVRVVLEAIAEEKNKETPCGNLPEVLVLAARKSSGFLQMAEKLGRQFKMIAVDDLCRSELADPGKRFCRIIIPALCPVGMADLALGRATGREMILLLGLLLKGYQVEVGEYEYTKYKNSASPQLYKLYQQYEKQLQQFGLQKLSKTDYAGNKKQTGQKTLVTEAILADMAVGNGEITLPKGALITSLAKDYAKEHGITLNIQGERREG